MNPEVLNIIMATTTTTTTTTFAKTPSSASTTTLQTAITSRHTTRAFLPTPVPTPLLQKSLALAARAPSNSNIQPWRLHILTGTALTRLTTALLAHASAGDKPPNIPPLPAWATQYRSELGRLVYGEGWGIARDDAEGRRKAVLGNFDFFGAPVGVVVTMRADLGCADALSVGMYLQTLVLALGAEGLGTAVEVSVAGYGEVVKEVLRLQGEGEEGEWVVLCGMAVGFEDGGARVNGIRTGRRGWEETTVWWEE